MSTKMEITKNALVKKRCLWFIIFVIANAVFLNLEISRDIFSTRNDNFKGINNDVSALESFILKGSSINYQPEDKRFSFINGKTMQGILSNFNCYSDGSCYDNSTFEINKIQYKYLTTIGRRFNQLPSLRLQPCKQQFHNIVLESLVWKVSFLWTW